MPELEVQIGGRNFRVACQDGEEPYLHAAAGLLDAEARVLADQAGRLTDSRLLLMAGLMLADKTAALEEDLRAAKARIDDSARLVDDLRRTPPRGAAALPAGLADGLAELAAQAEAAAEALAEKVARG